MSTIDIGATVSPLSRSHIPHSMAAQANPPVAQAIDDGDFYIGSTKINAIPAHNGTQAAQLISAK